jgi:hypothetical protein
MKGACRECHAPIIARTTVRAGAIDRDVILSRFDLPALRAGVFEGGRVTPILVRPVREQLEHDRVIRLLQQRWRRKYLASVNQGSETTASVVDGDVTLYPDVVLAPLGKPAKPEIVVEVETGESINHLEAMAQWTRLARLKAAFHLYLPAGSVDRARRLCSDYNIEVDEIWTYHLVGDQMRFTPVYKAPPASRPARRPDAAKKPAPRVAGKAPKTASKPPARRPEAAKPAARKAAKARVGKPAAKPAASKSARPKKAGARPAARPRKRR